MNIEEIKNFDMGAYVEGLNKLGLDGDKFKESFESLLKENNDLKAALHKSVALNFKYIGTLGKISCDTQYLNVAASSKGGENLIKMAKDVLDETLPKK